MVQFLQETFLLTSISLEIVLKILFLTFSKADIWFTEREFIRRIYMTTKALSTTRQVEIIRKIGFAAAALDANNKMFVIHIAALVKPTIMLIYPIYEAQIASLISTKIFAKYFDFSDISFSDH